MPKPIKQKVNWSAWSELKVPSPRLGPKQKSKMPFDHHHHPHPTFERLLSLIGLSYLTLLGRGEGRGGGSPRKKIQEPKNKRSEPITHILYWRIFSCYLKYDVCKKLQLNILIFGLVIATFVWKEKYFFYGNNFLRKNISIIQSIFKIWLTIFVLIFTDRPLDIPMT